MKTKKKKGLIIAAVLVVAVVLVVVLIPRNTTPVMAAISTEALAKTDLKNTINVTGLVESDSATDVYSQLASGTVQTVNVEVGDTVNAGDVLCQFDTEDIEDQIAQQKAQMADTSAQTQQSIKLSEKAYNQKLQDLQEDQDTALLNAKTAVASAQYKLKDAQYAVDHFGEPTGNNDFQTDEQLYGVALDEYKSAKEDFDNASKALEEAKKSKAPQATISNLEAIYSASKAAVNQKKEKYDIAKYQYFNADHLYEQTLDALKQAQDAYDQALQQYDIAWKSSLQLIDSAKDNIDTTKISSSQQVSRLTLEKYQKQLEDATVVAPVSGTVTAVYAKESATASGLLFIIEDTGNLKIRTTVKEYDLPSIKLGQKVEIKSDGTGDTVMTGTVSKIAPTAVKSTDPTKTSTSVEFEVEITVDKPHDGLLIGMKARVSIILSEALGVYGVPYDAVLTDADGSSYILVSEAGEKGMNVAKKIPVQVGMDSDFYVEVSGDGLSDGLQVITTPAGITEGMPLPAAQTPVV